MGNTPDGDVHHCHLGLLGQLGRIGLLFIVCIAPLFIPSTVPTESLAWREEHNWFYKREKGDLSINDSTVDILIVGDLMLGRGISRVENPFRNVANLLATADLTVGNFEGVISAAPISDFMDAETTKNGAYRLIAPARAAMNLQQAGFDLVSLANNHSLDLGPVGLVETRDRLNRAGIKTIGVAVTPEAAYQPVLLKVKGRRVAFLAFNAIPEPLNASSPTRIDRSLERLQAAIRSVRLVSDIIIVLVHWGDEYELRAGLNQRRAAAEWIEAGADVVVGSHPHVVQETQILDKGDKSLPGFVAYSLGNFVFDQYEENTRMGLALRLLFDQAGLLAVEALPVSAGAAPRWMTKSDSQDLLVRVQPEPGWLSFQCDRNACSPTHSIAGQGDGIFKSGQIDLNADGKLEIVRLQGGRVSIFEADQLKWESPAEWQVFDVALGDPNDDGRGEAVLVLRKPDNTGNYTSHPFIIGHRGGIYRQVWGGSAVKTPVWEVELSDLEGDGRQELIVLEGQDEETRTVSVWSWDDWVFKLIWRSAAGRYARLQVAKTGTKNLLTVGQIR